jgi:hypothetical protein
VSSHAAQQQRCPAHVLQANPAITALLHPNRQQQHQQNMEVNSSGPSITCHDVFLCGVLCHEDAWHATAPVQQLLPFRAACLAGQHVLVSKQYIKTAAVVEACKRLGS